MMKSKAYFSDSKIPVQVNVDPDQNELIYQNDRYKKHDVTFNAPISGTVYGAALNFKDTLENYKHAFEQEPYKAPPEAPVMYIKPINTITAEKASIPLPNHESYLQTGPSLGVVFNETATQVTKEEAFNYIKGYTVINDLSIPHESVHRPAIKEKARDKFCPAGPWLIQADQINNPDDLDIYVYINGELKMSHSTSNLVRSIPQLIADITAFMTFYAGDTLIVGVPDNAPTAQAGDEVTVHVQEVGSLTNTITSES
ncbi:5-carboxy-2-oxohept-3-enedioate decarboxylase HpaG1 subunit [Salsuginibacillus halophilus]|uniref:5-carboxy-2-oxohept-3-enedioate decarboxylase HpaG1 subunit n=1 Tax=Salsuginibacillus halophilus TaxID=517424 RepID=A0A2P8HQI1_9BACI|nr:fumarylacetoacetate hydrolase family protein [Salsuginibacillus halophilus]PSL48468.1 5-carboxy-2-oxohept-3-enedioate decarboxylase HpaG1 subunit [Salsuginibacillus halophilus]